MYDDQLVKYKVIIWAFFGISLWKEKVALTCKLVYLRSITGIDLKSLAVIFY